MNLLNDVPFGKENELNVIIEIPRGSRNKYEYDKSLQLFALDRPLNSSFAYITDYGFVPQTHCDDGDPLDAFVIMRHATYPGIVIKSRPIGVLFMTDSGEQDDKLICVPCNDPYYKDVKDLKDLPGQLIKEIKHFLEHYKDVKGGNVEITAVEGASRAKQVVKAAVELYKKQ
jgi:inorganic pyrophosphatase